MNRVNEIKRQRLAAAENRLAQLTQDAEAITRQRAGAELKDQPRLQRDLDAKYQDMEDVAQQIDQLQQELQQLELKEIHALPDALQELVLILTPIDLKVVSNTYQLCIEGRNRETPATLAALIARLNEIPGEPGELNPLLRFISILMQDQSLDAQQQQALRTWAQAQGLPNTATRVLVPPESRETYLMIKVQPRALNDASLGYLVSAAIMQDPDPHQPDAEVMPMPLTIPIPPGPKSAPGYAEDDLPRLLDALIAICGAEYGIPLTDLIVQWFLPIQLMSLPVEHWQIRIGRREHQNGIRCKAVMVRSFDRHFLPDYQMVSGDWKKYWQRLLGCLEFCCTQTLEVLDPATGLTEIAWSKAQVVGCRFMAHSDQQQQENLWDDLFGQGVPIALWLRQPGTSSQDAETVMQSVTNRPLRELPISLTEQRKAALAGPVDATLADQPCATHLSLLWDNPFRRFPTIDYQSA